MTREMGNWCKTWRFVYLVYVGLLFGKVKFADTLILDSLKKVLAKQFFDEGVFERPTLRVRGGKCADVVRIEQIGRKTRNCILGSGRSRGRIRDSSGRCVRLVTDFESLRCTRLGLWGGRPRVGLGHQRQVRRDGERGNGGWSL